MDRQALRFRARPGRHDHPHRHLPHRHRRQPRSQRRVALSRPEHHRAGALHHIRRRGAVEARHGPGHGGDRPAQRDLLQALSRRARRRDRTPARTTSKHRAVRLPLDPLDHPAPVSRRAAGDEHRHQRRRILRHGSRRAHRRDCQCEPVLRRDQRPLQGRLHHAPLWQTRAAACMPCRWNWRAAATCASRSGRSTKATGRCRSIRAYAAGITVTLRAILETCLRFAEDGNSRPS